MNPPQVYMCSPSWTLFPPHTIPLGRPSALAPSIQYRASNLNLSQLLPLTLSLQRVLITSAKPLSLLQSSSLTIFCQYCPSFENGLIFGLAEPHTILFFFFSYSKHSIFISFLGLSCFSCPLNNTHHSSKFNLRLFCFSCFSSLAIYVVITSL